MPQVHLAAAPLEELQRPLVVRDGFLVGERLGRAIAGEDPVADGCVRVAVGGRFAEVMRELGHVLVVVAAGGDRRSPRRSGGVAGSGGRAAWRCRAPRE